MASVNFKPIPAAKTISNKKQQMRASILFVAKHGYISLKVGSKERHVQILTFVGNKTRVATKARLYKPKIWLKRKKCANFNICL